MGTCNQVPQNPQGLEGENQLPVRTHEYTHTHTEPLVSSWEAGQGGFSGESKLKVNKQIIRNFYLFYLFSIQWKRANGPGHR